MKIEQIAENNKLTFKVSGRVDTVTAADFDKELETIGDSVNELVFDFQDLEYTSSAGLRVILKAQKLMATKGSLTIVNANENIKEIFDVTGFSDILDIQ